MIYGHLRFRRAGCGSAVSILACDRKRYWRLGTRDCGLGTGDMGLGTGEWGMGTGYRALAPANNPPPVRYTARPLLTNEGCRVLGFEARGQGGGARV